MGLSKALAGQFNTSRMGKEGKTAMYFRLAFVAFFEFYGKVYSINAGGWEALAPCWARLV